MQSRLPQRGPRDVLYQLFQAHPLSMDETYWQHQRHALQFALTMVSAGIACLIHAFVPVLFPRTASSAVVRLREQMARLGRIDGEHQPMGEASELFSVPHVGGQPGRVDHRAIQALSR